MKRFGIIALAAAILFALAACAGDPQNTSSEPVSTDTSLTESSVVEQSPEPVPESSEPSEPVSDESELAPVSEDSAEPSVDEQSEDMSEDASGDEPDPDSSEETSKRPVIVVVSKDEPSKPTSKDESDEPSPVSDEPSKEESKPSSDGKKSSIEKALKSLGVVSEDNKTLVCYTTDKEDDGGQTIVVIKNTGETESEKTTYRYYAKEADYEAAKAKDIGTADDKYHLILTGVTSDQPVYTVNSHRLILFMGYVAYRG